MQITEEIKQQIYDLYDESISSIEPFHYKIDLFIVPSELAHNIKEKTDIDVSNHWVCIDNYGIIHTMEHHGNERSEAKRGQIAIGKEDFITMIEVFLYPDEIKKMGVTRHNNLPILQFVKKMDDKIFVVKEVRTTTSRKENKISRLVFQTMYKIKAIKK